VACPKHPDWPGLAAACPFCEIVAGQFYGRTARGGLERLGPTAPRPPDVWICRRLADFPGGRVPAGGQVAACDRCAAPLVYNPARQVTAPKRCMQCSGIEPLPIES
jgi:hypothetical protein